MIRTTLLTAAAALALCTGARAANVYITSSGNDAFDTSLRASLLAAGHTATIGAEPHLLDGSQSFAGFNVVLYLPSYNWSAGVTGDAAQEALRAFVAAGGGLITSEWTLWRNGAGTPGSPLSVLEPAFAAAPTNSAYRFTATASFAAAAADTTIQAGLPASFTFPLENIGGTESQLTPKAGASVFYTSDTYGAGLIGKRYLSGRAANFSVVIAAIPLADAGFARLLNNTVTWAGNAPCIGDWDGNGEPNANDISTYINAWYADIINGTDAANTDGDPEVNANDLSEFINAWYGAIVNGGCPPR